MQKTIATAVVLAAATLFSMAGAQTETVDHFTQDQLMQQAQLLEQKASESGTAAVKLTEYPNHFTMISLRKKDGAAEVHLRYADFFFVLQGKATLVTGGTVVGPRTDSPGETRGASISGGTRISLEKGDIIHIPANVPHQVLLPEHSEFVYFVIKVQEQ